MTGLKKWEVAFSIYQLILSRLLTDIPIEDVPLLEIQPEQENRTHFNSEPGFL
jgi:hypothetical protein